MMIPEAWENHDSMDPARRAFYQYHSTMMEPWDGPACVTFTDGTQVGAVLDRNGLRPGRYWVTDDGLVVLASEVGVLDIDPAKVVRKGRLQPGRMFLVDTAEHRIIEDDEIKAAARRRAPVRRSGWRPARSSSRTCPSASTSCTPTPRSPAASRPSATPRRSCASSSRRWPRPAPSRSARWARTRRSPRCPSARGCSSTTSPSCSRRSPTRRWTPSARSSSPRCAPRSAPQGNLLEPTAASCRSVTLPFPVIDNDELAKLIHINADGDMPGMKAATLSGLYRVSGGGDALAARIEEICAEADAAIEDGARLIVLSDRHSDAEHAPIPSLLLTAAVHHHLIRTKQRTQVGLLVEAGDVREVHHVALLIGYGAAAVNPYLAMESVEDLVRAGTFLRGHRAREGHPQPDLRPRQGRPEGHVQDGHLDRRLLPRRPGLRGRRSRRGLRREVLQRHRHQDRRRRPRRHRQGGRRPARQGVPGLRHRRRRTARWRSAASTSGAARASRTCSTRRRSSASSTPRAPRRYDIFKKYTDRVNEQSERLMTLRGLFGFKSGPRSRSPSTRSSRSPRSSSASPPAPCRTAPSPRRRTRPSPSP